MEVATGVGVRGEGGAGEVLDFRLAGGVSGEAGEEMFSVCSDNDDRKRVEMAYPLSDVIMESGFVGLVL